MIERVKQFNPLQVAKLLSGTRLLGGLPEAELVKLARHARHRRFEAGEIIFPMHATGTPIYCVAEGRVKATSTGRTGNELLLRMYEPGEMFGELALADSRPRTVNAIAARPSYTIEFSKRHLLPVVEANASSAMAFSRILCGYIREAIVNIETVSLNDAKRRLWIRLIALGYRYGTTDPKTGRLRIKHGFSHQNLADSIGLTRVMVSRQLGIWRKEGLIENGRGVVEILNPDALESYVWQDHRSKPSPNR